MLRSLPYRIMNNEIDKFEYDTWAEKLEEARTATVIDGDGEMRARGEG